ncbi:MAG: polymorphic toxin-type HINT domain-containing protein [Pseudomonadota bacterium]
MTLTGGGSITDALKAAAFAFVSHGIWQGVDGVWGGLSKAISGFSKLGKSLVHGVVGGAMSVARGGNFLVGFATGALGKATSFISDTISQGNQFLDTLIVAASGCGASVIAGGKCANGAVTAAFANMYNKWGDYVRAGAEIGASFVPGVGEAQDAAVLLDPNSNAFERVIAGASLFLNVATGGVLPNAGGFIRAGRHLCSFHEDTQVATHQGFVKISEIRAGEHKVWARDEYTGKMKYKSVLDAYSSRYHKTVTVRIRDLQSDTYQTIISNTVHPFYVSMVQPGLRLVANGGVANTGTNDTGEWIEAQYLQAGHHLLNADESWSEVVSVEIAKQDLQAYNLHVDQFHTFYVRGADNDNAPGVWVHNTCFGDLRRHAAKHGDELGTNSTDAYLKQAAKNLANGHQFKFSHDGINKMAHITRMDDSSFMFTSSTVNGSRIFTHMRVNQQYLRNIGITLPKGF